MPTILDLLKIKVSDKVKSQMRGVNLKSSLVDIERKKAYELEQELFKWLKSLQRDFSRYRNEKEKVIKEY